MQQSDFDVKNVNNLQVNAIILMLCLAALIFQARINECVLFFIFFLRYAYNKTDVLAQIKCLYTDLSILTCSFDSCRIA